MIEYKTVRSLKRKTLSLQVKHGQVTVRAPYFISSSFINDFVLDKTPWLKNKIAEQITTNQDKCNFEDGSLVLHLGIERQLNVILAKRSAVYLNDENNSVVVAVGSQVIANITMKSGDDLVVQKRLFQEQVKKQLEGFFKAQMTSYLDQYLGDFVELTKLEPKSFQVRQYKSRWGSCNSKKELQFNYLLLMAPPWVINYVIIHELCHLKHLNHSSDFWHLVSSFEPDFRLAKAWFKTHQSKLHWRV
jgi:predicted metal-dependent hydrolase